jgi:TP901 family phage tail tape measure protein
MGLGFVFTARDLASAKMQRLERRFSSLDERVTGGTDRMTSAFRQLGVGLAIFTAGAAAVGGALALANAAGRFEQGLAAIGAVTRATTRELAMLREAAINAGIETQFSPTEAIQGLTSLATAGQTAAQATRTLIPVLDLAAGSLGQLGVASAAEAVVGTLNAYGMTADQAAGVTDRLLRITQLTNFQTRDFEAGLAKAAATGAVFNQGLNDVLITMGLLRNRNIDASSAATAFREATRRVGADSRAQQAILGTGVQVFDQTSGQMRSMVDIMSEFAGATRDMSDSERNRRVVQAFGARGLLAFNAVMNASFTTMRDGREVTLRGAEAIQALRNEMEGAEGTAGRFREQLLDTFEGQKTLLKGTLQTFAVVLGEPFAQVFKPIVRLLVNVLNAILRAFQAIPAPIKRIFAGLVVAVGGFLMLVGGVIAAKGAIALLAIGFKALGITIGGIMATLLPAILIVAVLGAVVAEDKPH